MPRLTMEHWTKAKSQTLAKVNASIKRGGGCPSVPKQRSLKTVHFLKNYYEIKLIAPLSPQLCDKYTNSDLETILTYWTALYSPHSYKSSSKIGPPPPHRTIRTMSSLTFDVWRLHLLTYQFYIYLVGPLSALDRGYPKFMLKYKSQDFVHTQRGVSALDYSPHILVTSGLGQSRNRGTAYLRYFMLAHLLPWGQRLNLEARRILYLGEWRTDKKLEIIARCVFMRQFEWYTLNLFFNPNSSSS